MQWSAWRWIEPWLGLAQSETNDGRRNAHPGHGLLSYNHGSVINSCNPENKPTAPLRRFGRDGEYVDFEVLRTQDWVSGGQAHRAGLLFGPNPNRAGAADKRKRIVADDFRRSRQVELDSVVGEGTNGAKLVGDAKDDAGCVGAVGVERCVVGTSLEFLVNSLPRESFGDD